MSDARTSRVAVPLDLLIDISNELNDCLCYPSGTVAHDELLKRLDEILEGVARD